jgi:hypothetical protein
VPAEPQVGGELGKAGDALRQARLDVEREFVGGHRP